MTDRPIIFSGPMVTDGHDQEFIAHAREDIPALVAHIDWLKSLLDGRDEFIISKGLFGKFVNSLKPEIPG